MENFRRDATAWSSRSVLHGLIRAVMRIQSPPLRYPWWELQRSHCLDVVWLRWNWGGTEGNWTAGGVGEPAVAWGGLWLVAAWPHNSHERLTYHTRDVPSTLESRRRHQGARGDTGNSWGLLFWRDLSGKCFSLRCWAHLELWVYLAGSSALRMGGGGGDGLATWRKLPAVVKKCQERTWFLLRSSSVWWMDVWMWHDLARCVLRTWSRSLSLICAVVLHPDIHYRLFQSLTQKTPGVGILTTGHLRILSRWQWKKMLSETGMKSSLLKPCFKMPGGWQVSSWQTGKLLT